MFFFAKWTHQVRARARGIDEEETRTEASKAIQSIPAYVEVSSAFVALVPAIKEQSSAHGFDYTTWITRGMGACLDFLLGVGKRIEDIEETSRPRVQVGVELNCGVTCSPRRKTPVS